MSRLRVADPKHTSSSFEYCRHYSSCVNGRFPPNEHASKRPVYVASKRRDRRASHPRRCERLFRS